MDILISLIVVWDILLPFLLNLPKTVLINNIICWRYCNFIVHCMCAWKNPNIILAPSCCSSAVLTPAVICSLFQGCVAEPGTWKIEKNMTFWFPPFSSIQNGAILGPLFAATSSTMTARGCLCLQLGDVFEKSLWAFGRVLQANVSKDVWYKFQFLVFRRETNVPLCVSLPLSPLLLISNPHDYYWISHPRLPLTADI